MGLGRGTLLGKLSTFLPSRVEKLKNERHRLVEENARLVRGQANAKTAARVEWITARLATLERLLADKASD